MSAANIPNRMRSELINVAFSCHNKASISVSFFPSLTLRMEWWASAAPLVVGYNVIMCGGTVPALLTTRVFNMKRKVIVALGERRERTPKLLSY